MGVRLRAEESCSGRRPSPEHNASDRVRLYLRERFLSPRVLDDADAIIDRCFEAWNALLAETGRVRSLAASPPGQQGSIPRGAGMLYP